jgi:Holliday junction DNA helicase RuvA
VGKKTAARLVVEMRDRYSGSDAEPPAAPAGSWTARAADPAQEARQALIALGYKPQEADRLLRRVEQGGQDSEPFNSEQLIRMALRQAVK